MADRYYNVPLGGTMAEDVTEGGADTSQYVAVRVTYDATGNSKQNTILALEAAIQYLIGDSWPPA